MFKDIYLQLITQMNNQNISNISQNMQNDFDLDKIFSKDDGFVNKPLKYTSSKYVGYHTLDKIQLDVDIQLDNGYHLWYIKLFGPIEIEFGWSPYQPQTRDYPGNPGGLQEISAVNWPFTKNLNDKNNDKVFELLIDTGSQEVTNKFSELSIKDRYIIFEKLTEYIQSEQFFENFNEILYQYEKDKDEAQIDQYQRQRDYYDY